MGNGNKGGVDWEVLSVKVQPNLYDRIEEHREEGDYSTNSENVRALIRKGLDAGSGGVTPLIGVIWLGSLLVSSALEWNFQTISTDVIAVLGFVLMIGAGAYSYIRSN